jgi:Xaa-Pro aminopeptidase
VAPWTGLVMHQLADQLHLHAAAARDPLKAGADVQDIVRDLLAAVQKELAKHTGKQAGA